jgi:ABC-type phosphate transport system substrate-binding protein
MDRFMSIVTKLSVASLLLASTAFAQVQYNAAGSSAMFNTFAFAARLGSSPCGQHNWSKKNGGATHDGRRNDIQDVTGNIWVVWDDSNNPTVICAYLSIDSAIGDRSFFAFPSAILSMPSGDIGSNGDQLVPAPMPPDEQLPQAVYTALNNSIFNAAMTDIRPEDALFATNRALAPLTKDRSGLGYGPGPVGTEIHSEFSSSFVQPVAFALSGPDPISGQNIPFQYTTTNIGASPVVVFVNDTILQSGHFGNPRITNALRFPLALMLDGTLTRCHDLTTSLVAPSAPAHVMLREPLSGTYNTMEFNIPRSAELGLSQEDGVDPSQQNGNPLNISYPSGGTRQRVVGTGQMVSEVVATPDAIGYAFWSFGNFANAVSSTKYLTVDGIDPLRNIYSNGFFPTCTNPPCPGLLTFPHIQDGTYPIWSILRMVTVSPVPSFIQTLLSAAQTEAGQIPDFVPSSQLFVFRSHYNQSGVTGANGHLNAEAGGDVGGAPFTLNNDYDSINDYNMELLGYKQ